MLDALSALIATQRNKPLSILVAALALFAPASLIPLIRQTGLSSMGERSVSTFGYPPPFTRSVMT